MRLGNAARLTFQNTSTFAGAMGNAALALMLTVVTNIVAVFILPYSITLVIPQSTGVNINAVQLLEKLVLTILVPLIVGKAIRELSSWVRKQAAAHKFALTMINNTSLILIVWMTVSSAQQNIVHTGFGTLCLIALAAILLHVIYLCVNFVLVKVLRLPQPEAAAVLVMGSEKTLPMAVTVIAYLPAVLGTAGQLTVPCVIAHISQVLMDAAITERMGSRVRAAAKKKEIADAEASEEAVEGGADVEKVSGTGASTPGAKEETAPASEATASDLGDGGDAGKPCTTEP